MSELTFEQALEEAKLKAQEVSAGYVQYIKSGGLENLSNDPTVRDKSFRALSAAFGLLVDDLAQHLDFVDSSNDKSSLRQILTNTVYDNAVQVINDRGITEVEDAQYLVKLLIQGEISIGELISQDVVKAISNSNDNDELKNIISGLTPESSHVIDLVFDKALRGQIESDENNIVQEFKSLVYALTAESCAADELKQKFKEFSAGDTVDYNELMSYLKDVVDRICVSTHFTQEGSFKKRRSGAGDLDVAFIGKNGRVMSVQATVDQKGDVEGHSLIRHPIAGHALSIIVDKDNNDEYFISTNKITEFYNKIYPNKKGKNLSVGVMKNSIQKFLTNKDNTATAISLVLDLEGSNTNLEVGDAAINAFDKKSPLRISSNDYELLANKIRTIFYAYTTAPRSLGEKTPYAMDRDEWLDPQLNEESALNNDIFSITFRQIQTFNNHILSQFAIFQRDNIVWPNGKSAKTLADDIYKKPNSVVFSFSSQKDKVKTRDQEYIAWNKVNNQNQFQEFKESDNYLAFLITSLSQGRDEKKNNLINKDVNFENSVGHIKKFMDGVIYAVNSQNSLDGRIDAFQSAVGALISNEIMPNSVIVGGKEINKSNVKYLEHLLDRIQVDFSMQDAASIYSESLTNFKVVTKNLISDIEKQKDEMKELEVGTNKFIQEYEAAMNEYDALTNSAPGLKLILDYVNDDLKRDSFLRYVYTDANLASGIKNEIEKVVEHYNQQNNQRDPIDLSVYDSVEVPNGGDLNEVDYLAKFEQITQQIQQDLATIDFDNLDDYLKHLSIDKDVFFNHLLLVSPSTAIEVFGLGEVHKKMDAQILITKLQEIKAKVGQTSVDFVDKTIGYLQAYASSGGQDVANVTKTVASGYYEALISAGVDLAKSHAYLSAVVREMESNADYQKTSGHSR